ncbi:MAG: BMP family ABC transporter substrate-binding protein [Chloroflexi bacterium]|nr:BMP family ABC transporter substrate-binding protein [Chloroflexota bacterium]
MLRRLPKKLLALASIAAAVILATAACGGSSSPTAKPAAGTPAHAPFVMGIIHVGSKTDAGYNQAHAEAAAQVVKNLPYVKLLETENIPENADVSRVIENMIAQGAKFIVPASFGYLDPALDTASKHPDVMFDHPAGFKQADNFHTYWAASDQYSYALGMAAGKMTKTNKLGFIAGFQIPNIIDSVNAFTLGARSVNPKAEMRVIYDNAWLDSAKEAASTNALADQGVDVVTMIVDSPITVVKTAESRGMYTVGFHSTAVQQYAPKGWIGGIGFTWGGFFTREVQAIEAGTWKSNPKNLIGSLTTDMVTLAPFGSAVPDDVKQTVQAKIQDFKSGKAQVFAGPIKDNKGNLKIAAGQVGDPSLVNTFDWYVEGVVGQ